MTDVQTSAPVSGCQGAGGRGQATEGSGDGDHDGDDPPAATNDCRPTTVRAVCPAGTLVSGGGYVAGASQVQIAASHPFGEHGQQGWEVRALNADPGSAHSVQVEALCLTPNAAQSAPAPTSTPGHDQPAA